MKNIKINNDIELDSSPLVVNVRREMDKRLGKGLKGSFNDLRALAFASLIDYGRWKVNFKGYAIEDTVLKKTAGFYISGTSYFSNNDAVSHYGLFASKVLRLQVVALREEADTQYVYQDHRQIGKIRVVGKQEILWSERPSEWEIFVGEELFGRIKVGKIVPTVVNVETQLSGFLPLHLGFNSTFSDFLKVIFRLLTFRWVTSVNTDLIIPKEWPSSLTNDRLKVIFMAALIFRTFYFSFDFNTSD